jgi:lipopolysaccharide O-acetyltransferase
MNAGEGVAWRAWMENVEHLQHPPPAYARPVGLGSLGSESYFIEPYKIRSPHRVHVGDGVGIGERCFLSVVDDFNGAKYEPTLTIADNVLISTDLFVQCVGSVEIGEGAQISARVFIGDSARDYENPHVAGGDLVIDEGAPVKIGAGALIALGSMILPGVTIGERAIVGGGSVVTRDVPSRSVVFGNPARILRRWDEEKQRWRMGG